MLEAREPQDSKELQDHQDSLELQARLAQLVKPVRLVSQDLMVYKAPLVFPVDSAYLEYLDLLD